MRDDEWLPQLRRGVLELVALAFIGVRPRYGYELVAALQDSDALAVPEATVYPLVRRLRQQGLLSSEAVPSVSGPPRVYYRLTPAGLERLATLRSGWESVVHDIHALLRSNA